MTYDTNHKTKIKDLKVLGEEIKEIFDSLDSRTQPLTWDNAAIHNSIARGENLGAFTSGHLAEIRAGTFRGMWLKDYFTLTGELMAGKRAWIAGFRYLGSCRKNNNMTLICETPVCVYNNNDNPKAPYGESYWYTEMRPQLITEIEAFFAGAGIPEYTVMGVLSYEAGTNNPDAWVALSSKIHLPTYSMIAGTVFSPYHHHNPTRFGTAFPNDWYWTQLPLYQMRANKESMLFSVVSDCEFTTNHGTHSGANQELMYEPKRGSQNKLVVFHIQ